MANLLKFVLFSKEKKKVVSLPLLKLSYPAEGDQHFDRWNRIKWFFMKTQHSLLFGEWWDRNYSVFLFFCYIIKSRYVRINSLALVNLPFKFPSFPTQPLWNAKNGREVWRWHNSTRLVRCKLTSSLHLCHPQKTEPPPAQIYQYIENWKTNDPFECVKNKPKKKSYSKNRTCVCFTIFNGDYIDC